LPRRTLAERTYLELVREYQTPILNYIYRLVGDRELAEDLTQDAFVKAYGALERLELEDDAAVRRRAWLYRIAHNLATDHLRRKARIAWLPLDLRFVASGGSPEHRVVAADPVRRALARVSSEHREVLILFGVNELSAAEVGEILGISEAAARKRRQRARAAFIEAYEIEAHEEVAPDDV
jgi:RNA polymerase sigma-70 factor (ECF subfamily)